MRSIWSISTTLRNPERIRGFLKVLSLLEGEVWGKITQRKFQVLLIQGRCYGAGNKQFYKGLKREQIELLESSEAISYKKAEEILDRKKYVGAGDMRGRQSYNPIEKAGLAFIDEHGEMLKLVETL